MDEATAAATARAKTLSMFPCLSITEWLSGCKCLMINGRRKNNTDRIETSSTRGPFSGMSEYLLINISDQGVRFSRFHPISNFDLTDEASEWLLFFLSFIPLRSFSLFAPGQLIYQVWYNLITIKVMVLWQFWAPFTCAPFANCTSIVGPSFSFPPLTQMSVASVYLSEYGSVSLPYPLSLFFFFFSFRMNVIHYVNRGERERERDIGEASSTRSVTSSMATKQKTRQVAFETNPLRP